MSIVAVVTAVAELAGGVMFEVSNPSTVEEEPDVLKLPSQSMEATSVSSPTSRSGESTVVTSTFQTSMVRQ